MFLLPATNNLLAVAPLLGLPRSGRLSLATLTATSRGHSDYGDFDLCWGAAPCVGDSGLSVGRTLRALLGLPPSPPPLRRVVAHLAFLAALDGPGLAALNRVRPKPTSGGRGSRGAMTRG